MVFLLQPISLHPVSILSIKGGINFDHLINLNQISAL